MIQLSVVIIAYNEAEKIGRCIDSAREIADDIVVIDSYSTDATERVCLERGARVVKRAFAGYIQQKNFALTQALHPHVLALDADEALSERLRESIRAAKAHWRHAGYAMNRLNHYCGRPIRHGGAYPDRKLRFWDKRLGNWGGTNPHDTVVLQKGSRIGFLKGDILHYTFDSVAGHREQARRFAAIAAESVFAQGRRASLLALYLHHPALMFLKNYILRLGFLDGYYGIALCSINAEGSFLKYARLRALSAKQESVSSRDQDRIGGPAKHVRTRRQWWSNG